MVDGQLVTNVIYSNPYYICDLDIPLPQNLPQPCSVRYLVENYWDIQGVPRRYFFELLSHLTDSELEKEKLQEFNTAEGQVLNRK